ncbi:MAG: hypothetical protein IPL53_17185 [Ignavibacteria bacterium]|nr:hypothetical protein [Ignavibacteria bacterium]
MPEYTGLKAYIRKLRLLFYSPEGRVIEVNSGDAAESMTRPDLKQYKYELKDNYPNPFNPVTTIKYELAVNGYTTLKVYDILGKEVTNLVS